MWDAHCHLDDPRIIDDIEGIVDRARSAGVEGMILAGYGPSRWTKQRKLCSRYDGCFMTMGLHPWRVAALPSAPPEPPHLNEDQLLASLIKAIEALPQAEAHHLVGLGEFGLDRSQRCGDDTWERQLRLCRAQLALAREHELPVVLHVVQAHGAMLAMLRDDGLPRAGGMIHGFTGSLGLAEEYIRLGLHISFGGRITYTNARKAREAAASLPDERLLAETDAPDTLPAQLPPGAPNEPANLPLVIEALVELRGQSAAQLASLTQRNTMRLFQQPQ